MTTLTSRIVRFTTAAALGLGLLWSAPSRGAPPNTIANSVAVCDPWNPQRCAQPDASGNLPITGSFSAAGFTPATTGTPISVTTSGVTGTLPAGAVVAAFNVGTTNTAYCKLGASATTSDIAIPPASWFAFTVGAATQLTCITASSTTTVNMVGGSGQPTGAGGGGGGSGGGAVTIADGADVTQGAKADAACGTDTATCSQIALIKRLLQGITTLNTNVTASIPAGTNLIGDVNLRQGGTVLSATNPTFAAPIPAASGGLSVYFLQPTASTNSNNIKNAAGQVYKIDVFNNSATVHYIRLYNTATTGTCNSATNLVWQGIIPASTAGAGLSSSWDLGMAFSSGIALCVTSGYDGTGNATASALIVNVGYK